MKQNLLFFIPLVQMQTPDIDTGATLSQ